MWNAIYNTLKYQTVERVALNWNADLTTLRLVNKGINLVYCFEVDHQPQFLRVTHPSLRSFAEVDAAIAYQLFLFQQNASICAPLLSINCKFIENAIQGHETFYAHVSQGLPGESIAWSTMTQEHCFAWGNALANLHLAASKFKADHTRYKNWRQLWQETESYLSKDDDCVFNEFMQINYWLSTTKKFNTGYYALTHGDHRLGNVIRHEEKIYIIDFDEPVYHWLHADIARPLLDMTEQNIAQFSSFLQGYHALIKLDEEDIKALAWFARMKNLEIYLWTKQHWLQGNEAQIRNCYQRMQQVDYFENLIKVE